MFRPIVSLSFLTLLGLVLAPLQWLAVTFNLPAMRRIPMLFHRWGLPLIGIKVTSRGVPAQIRPLLICSNHVSWLDIPVISSLMPLIFVSKADVGSWPVFGTLARLQRSVFIDRTRRSATQSATQEMTARLNGGDAVVLFPEGTTSDGNRVLGFRSSLLGAACQAALAGEEKKEIHIQPVAIRYFGLHGLPIGRAFQPYAAWYGDMDLVPHLIDILKLGALEVEVRFGAPMTFSASSGRKTIAAQIEKAVRDLWGSSFSNRLVAVKTRSIEDKAPAA